VTNSGEPVKGAGIQPPSLAGKSPMSQRISRWVYLRRRAMKVFLCDNPVFCVRYQAFNMRTGLSLSRTTFSATPPSRVPVVRWPNAPMMMREALISSAIFGYQGAGSFPSRTAVPTSCHSEGSSEVSQILHPLSILSFVRFFSARYCASHPQVDRPPSCTCRRVTGAQNALANSEQDGLRSFARSRRSRWR
jgi:hypothetical protein